MLTAACCIIGDEILSGKTKDTNSNYLAKKLFDLGIELKSIQVVGDNKHDIQKCIRELSFQYDLVFTSGGIGPTHDDITYESIAGAFNLELKLDQETYDYIENRMKTKMTKYHARMATFPSPAKLLRLKAIPVVVVNENVYILPGVPSLFKLLLDSLDEQLKVLSAGMKFYRKEIATKESELKIADTLTKVQESLDDIKIGSYPVWGQEDIKVIVSVSGKNQQQVDQTAQQLANQIHGWIYHKQNSHL